ncbi:hypothetical protein BS78_01G346400 [Paspalum vaginatum]|nr:hypothetical protein BS78_01G346400 [Paspalum vaginatum]
MAATQVPNQADVVVFAQVGGHAAALAAAQIGGHLQLEHEDLAGHGVTRSSSSTQLEHEEIPDWFQGVATAALGEEWMSSEPNEHISGGASLSVSVGASPSTAVAQHHVEVLNQRTVQATSTRRKGGRAPRPPIAARAVDVDLTDARTGRLYERKQFKNKWEKLKGDYTVWKELTNRFCHTKQTGIGWDETHTDIIMPEAWWKKMAVAVKGSNRFRNRGLQNEKLMSIMFQNIHNTGDDHWCASSGVAPTQPDFPYESSPQISLDEEDNYDSDPEDVTPTSSRSKRGSSQGQTKGKKTKTSGGQWFQDKMGELVAMNERTTASCESMASREDKSRFSINEVECGATSGTNEHFIATIAFTKRAEREMFMTLDTPEKSFEWLKRKHEWMTRNDLGMK